MSLKLLGLLKENQDRVVTPNSHISNSKVQSLIQQGYKPYRIANGELKQQKTSARFELKFDYKDDSGVNIFFLSEEEVAQAERVIEKIKALKQAYLEQIKLFDKYVPSYVYHQLLKNSGS